MAKVVPRLPGPARPTPADPLRPPRAAAPPRRPGSRRRPRVSRQRAVLAPQLGWRTTRVSVVAR
eukprot:7216360-Alexandrium_andersonii.AAC.1